MSDEETQEMPNWAKDLKPLPPIPEELRQKLILLEIKRQQDAYYRDNPASSLKQPEQPEEPVRR